MTDDNVDLGAFKDIVRRTLVAPDASRSPARRLSSHAPRRRHLMRV